MFTLNEVVDTDIYTACGNWFWAFVYHSDKNLTKSNTYVGTKQFS